MLMQEPLQDVDFREARQPEIQRARLLLGDKPRKDFRYFVAVSSRPVERFVGVAAWMTMTGTNATARNLRFDWTVIPGWQTACFPGEFLCRFTDQFRGHDHLSLRAMRLVEPLSWEAEAFRSAGFSEISRHEHFHLDNFRPRHDRVNTRLPRKPQLPSLRTIESLTPANCEAAATIIDQHHLLSYDSFLRGYRDGIWQEFSALLMNGQQAEGVLLARQDGPQNVSIYVLAADPEARIYSGKACFYLFEFLRERCDKADIRNLYFWAEPDRSPATRRLALRFGGRMIRQTVQYGVCL
jgi:hypothetical protein